MKISNVEQSNVLQTNDKSSYTLSTNEKETRIKEEEINLQNILEPLDTNNSQRNFEKAKISFSCQHCHENLSNKIELLQHEQIHIDKYFTHEKDFDDESNGNSSVDLSKTESDDPKFESIETIEDQNNDILVSETVKNQEI